MPAALTRLSGHFELSPCPERLIMTKHESGKARTSGPDRRPSTGLVHRNAHRRGKRQRLFVVMAGGDQTISRIQQLATACVEIELLHREPVSGQTSFIGPRRVAASKVDLTQRQFEIALGVTRGLSNKDIGRELGISHFTVRNHLSRILLLHGLSTREDLRDFVSQQLGRLTERLHGLHDVASPDIAPGHEHVGQHDANAIIEEGLDLGRPTTRQPCAKRN